MDGIDVIVIVSTAIFLGFLGSLVHEFVPLRSRSVEETDRID